MQAITHFVKECTKLGGNALLLAPFSQPRMRTHQGWVPIREELIESTSCRELLFSVLTTQQREKLEQQGLVFGSVSLYDGTNLSFEIYRNKLGFSGIIKELSQEIPPMVYEQLPPLLLEQVIKTRGIVVVAGGDQSGKTTLLNLIITKLNKEENLHIVVAEDCASMVHSSDKSIVSQIELDGGMSADQYRATLASGDVIFLDTKFNKQLLTTVLELAECGKKIFLSSQADSLPALLNQWIYRDPNKAETLDLIAGRLSAFINQRLLNGIDQGVVLAQEFFLFNEKLKQMVAKKDWPEFNRNVQEFSEKWGAKSLNQSLVQLCVRRKLELKAAYQASYDPLGLDQLFAKMGI